jgi:hypothetical protein
MNQHMNGNVRTKLILTTLIVVAVVVVALVVALWATSTSLLPPFPLRYRQLPPQYTPPSEDIELFYTVETVFSMINVMLSIVLLITYLSIYWKTRSEFTIGLTIFSAVFLLHAIVSIPLIHRAFGFYEFGLGPFAMLPNLFTCFALVVLLYLSVTY